MRPSLKQMARMRGVRREAVRRMRREAVLALLPSTAREIALSLPSYYRGYRSCCDFIGRRLFRDLRAIGATKPEEVGGIWTASRQAARAIKEGERFGKLTITETRTAGSYDLGEGPPPGHVRVRCECGTRFACEVESVLRGTSCGCDRVRGARFTDKRRTGSGASRWGSKRKTGVCAVSPVAEEDVHVQYLVVVGGKSTLHDDFAEAAAEYELRRNGEKAEPRKPRNRLEGQQKEALLRAWADGVEIESLMDQYGKTALAIRHLCRKAGVRRPEGYHGVKRKTG